MIVAKKFVSRSLRTVRRSDGELLFARRRRLQALVLFEDRAEAAFIAEPFSRGRALGRIYRGELPQKAAGIARLHGVAINDVVPIKNPSLFICFLLPLSSFPLLTSSFLFLFFVISSISPLSLSSFFPTRTFLSPSDKFVRLAELLSFEGTNEEKKEEPRKTKDKRTSGDIFNVRFKDRSRVQKNLSSFIVR